MATQQLFCLRTAWVAIVLGFGGALFMGGWALSAWKKKAGTQDAEEG